jgi:hypothetical protein
MLDAGSNPDADASASTVSGVRWSGWPASNDLNETCLAGGDPAIAGSWQGQFDSYTFPSGSADIRLQVVDAETSAPNAPCGKIVFGAGEQPPLPTDPGAFYPPGQPYADHPIRSPYEGFRYDFSGPPDSQVNGQSLRLGIMTGQIYKAWCEIQLSYPQPPFASIAYACTPAHLDDTEGPDGSDCVISNAGETMPVSCAELSLCQACACQWNGCTLTFAPDVHVDITFQGDTATGSASFPEEGIETFHLQRMP